MLGCELTRDEVSITETALRVAIEVWRKDSEIAEANRNSRLGEQFVRQIEQAERVLERLEKSW